MDLKAHRSKRASRRSALLLVVLAVALDGCGYSNVISQPSFGPGISEISGLDVDWLSWSPDAKYLVGVKTVYPWPDCFMPGCLFALVEPAPYSKLVLVDTETWDITLLQKTDFSDRYFNEVTWTPDSSRIIFTSFGADTEAKNGVLTMDVDGNEGPPFLDGSNFPAWASDGLRFADVERKATSAGRLDIIVSRSFTGGARRQEYVADDPSVSIGSLSWKWDDSEIVFVVKQTYRTREPGEVWSLRLPARSVRQVLRDKADYMRVQYSPVAELMALTIYDHSDTLGGFQTILKDLESACELRIPVPDGWLQDWSPDGTKLIISSHNRTYLVDLVELIGPDFIQPGSLCVEGSN